MDRNNENVAYDYMPDRPVFWKLVQDIVKAADETGRPLSVCGEIAAIPEHLSKLMELGIKTVSVSTRMIPRVRIMARNVLRMPGRGVVERDALEVARS